MKFYLGTHLVAWLWRTDVPLFVSHRQLRKQKTWGRAITTWALDSGGFTELSQFGKWSITPHEYVEAARRYRDEIGGLDFIAPQDWMCEPWIVAKTGLTVLEHQHRTTENFLLLRDRAPDLPVIPVVQGWALHDYVTHVDIYAANGVQLQDWPTVGIGSVCRRQSTDEIRDIITLLREGGLRLHGFGVKGAGIAKYGHLLASADSMAWSRTGRDFRPCPHTGKASCSNCLTYALEWRSKFVTDPPQEIAA